MGALASLIHTSADGMKDAAPGETVRIYMLDGLQQLFRAVPATEGHG